MALEELIVLVIVLALVAMFALANKSVFSYFGNTTITPGSTTVPTRPITVDIQTDKYYDGIATLVNELNTRKLVSSTNDEILFTSSTNNKKLGGNDVVVLFPTGTNNYKNRDKKGAMWNTLTNVTTRASMFEKEFKLKPMVEFIPNVTKLDNGVFVIVTQKFNSAFANLADALNIDGIGFFQKPFKFIYALTPSTPIDSVCVYSKSKNFCEKLNLFPRDSMSVFRFMQRNDMLGDAVHPQNDGDFVIVTQKSTVAFETLVDALNRDASGFFQKPVRFFYASSNSIPIDSVCVFSKSKNLCTKSVDFPMQSSMSVFQFMQINNMLEDKVKNNGDFIIVTQTIIPEIVNVVNALNIDGRGLFLKPVRFIYAFSNSIPIDSVCVYSNSQKFCTHLNNFPRDSMSVFKFMQTNNMFGDAVHPSSPGPNVIDCDNIRPISNTPPSVEMCDEKKYHCYMLRTSPGKDKNQCMTNKNRLEAVRNVYNDTMQANFMKSPNTQKPFRFYGALDNSLEDSDKVFSTIDQTGMVVFETHNDIDNKKNVEMSGHITSYLSRAATSGNQQYI